MRMRARRLSFLENAGPQNGTVEMDGSGRRAGTTGIVRDPVQNRSDRRVTTAIAQLVCLTAMRALTF
jgi:hypothetical protein